MTLLERDPLLRNLRDRLGGVAGGGGHFVLVSGEAGIGKTSLLTALADARGTATLWWGACDALQTPHPLAPLHDVARAGITGFGEVLGADRGTVFERVLDVLQRSEAPILFVVEDVHWADEATLDLLKFVGRRIDRAPCLLVASYRDDEVHATHPLRRLMGELPAARLTRIEVPRLSPDAVAVLARTALRAPEGLYDITQGNPFFVTEVLRHGQGTVPRAVQDVVLGRLSQLSAPAQAIARLVAIVPARIERWLIDALLGEDTSSVEACLDSGLLIAEGATLRFRHELARVAVESSLSATRAQTLHANLLAALENDATTSLARRVHHAVHARDRVAVLRYAPAAAREASQRGAHTQAVAQWRNALAFADTVDDVARAEFLEQLAYELYLTDHITDAITAFESALALRRAAGHSIKAGDILRWLSRLSWYNGQTELAERYATQAIELLEPLQPGRELAMAYSNRSQLLMLSGENESAVTWGRKALALALELGDREIEIHALNNIGTASADDDEATGFDNLQRSLDLALAGGFEEHAARAYTNLSFIATVARDLPRASKILGEGIAYCEARDLHSWVRYMCSWRADYWMAVGAWDQAETEAQAIIEVTNVAPISRMGALAILARIRARRGDDATALLDEALQLARQASDFTRLGPVAAARAEAAWLRDDRAGVAREVEEAWRAIRAPRHLRWITGELAYWLHRVDALPEVPSCLPEPYALQIAGRWRDAAAAWQRLGCPYEQARSLADGDTAAQREALTIFDRLGANIDAERVRKQLRAAGERGIPSGPRNSTQANPHALTTREVEVLRLLCLGLKNAQIAKRLSRSVRTVDHHLAAVFAKLGVTTRTEAMAVAVANGIHVEK
jgi:DNA-binding CsgD family transcriptional regulator